MKYLVTGAAGFIGHYVVKRLCALGHTVVGLDNLNDYYEVSLKEARLNELSEFTDAGLFSFVKMNLEDTDVITYLFKNRKFRLSYSLGGTSRRSLLY